MARAVRLLLFRFGWVYWILFCSPLLSEELPGLGWLASGYDAVCDRLTALAAHHIFHVVLPPVIQQNGSGDTTNDYLRLAVFAGLALLAAIIWSLFDRRPQYPRLQELERVLLRYALAFIMLSYGSIKLLGGQFPPPGASRLLQSFGDSSPMGLLWTFMGYSKPYVIFSGAGETLGALLLLHRRTTTLGALVLVAVLTNVVFLNFCYDVPVKINSVHYLAMAVILLLPDLGRLANLLVFNRATQPAEQRLQLPRRWMRITRLVIKGGVLALVGVMILLGIRSQLRFDRHPRNDLEGYWNVERFTRDGQPVPAVITDATRWRRLKLESDEESLYLRWHNMDRSYGPLFTVVTDEGKRTMTLTTVEEQPAKKFQLGFVRVDHDHFRLEGAVGAAPLAVELQRYQPEATPLMTRGFHFINEVPYNR